MTAEDPQDIRSEDRTLQQAEARFHEAMILLGWAMDEVKARVQAGDLPTTSDIRATGRDLGEAWRALQRERDKVAQERRKRGELVGGDLDLGAARAAVCEQLDSIARSLQAD